MSQTVNPDSEVITFIDQVGYVMQSQYAMPTSEVIAYTSQITSIAGGDTPAILPPDSEAINFFAGGLGPLVPNPDGSFTRLHDFGTPVVRQFSEPPMYTPGRDVFIVVGLRFDVGTMRQSLVLERIPDA